MSASARRGSGGQRFPDRGEDFTVTPPLVNPCEVGSVRAFEELISSALSRLRDARGGLWLAAQFDGKAIGDDGRPAPVAESTVSMWIRGTRQFPAANLPILATLDGEFVRHGLPLLFASVFAPQALMEELSPETRKDVLRATQNAVQRSLFGDVHPKARR